MGMAASSARIESEKVTLILSKTVSLAAACLLCFDFVFVAAADQESLRTYNDSEIYLVAKGQVSEFRYQKPRRALIPFGVTPGTLVFRGVFRNGEYVGTAFTFTRECGALSFPARGPILDNGKRVRLAGRLPQVDAWCQNTGSVEQKLLEFRLVKMYDVAPGTQNRFSQIEVPLKKVGGTYVVPVEINEAITLDFTVDSGAAHVSVPADVFSTLGRKGTIQASDIIGEQIYILADGSESKSFAFAIQSLKVGGIVIDNVKGGVAPQEGSLLLGQSFLERFKSWSIDNTKHVLILEPQ
jgi:clan AA aspartic protease (TIGR02281 family)